MDFKAASDQATAACITLQDIATAAGVSHNAIRRARLKKNGDSFRSPPTNWQSAIAKLARERAAELVKLAEELEG